MTIARLLAPEYGFSQACPNRPELSRPPAITDRRWANRAHSMVVVLVGQARRDTGDIAGS